MHILIFGASGAAGHELVRQGLNQGHAVTAFVRDPAKLVLREGNLSVVQGDVKDYSTIERVLGGHDAVLSALGVSAPLKKDPIVIEGIGNIIRAMERSVVKRLVYLSFLAVGEGRKDSGFLMKHLISRIVHNELEDHKEKEKLITSSQLEWTIVRAPKLTNGSARGVYRTGEDIKVQSLLPTMSRADVADFMLRQLTDRTYLHKTPRILY